MVPKKRAHGKKTEASLFLFYLFIFKESRNPKHIHTHIVCVSASLSLSLSLSLISFWLCVTFFKKKKYKIEFYSNLI